LAALDRLTFIGGSLSILGYRYLTSLAGLENVSAASIDNIAIYDNIALSACNIQSLCKYLAAPNGTVDIYSNATGCNSPAEIANMCGITMPCLPHGNYYFFSQADVDNFKAAYPGCSDLQGDVSITGDDIVNLSVLSEVTSIAGDLNIGRKYGRKPIGNPLLHDLTGLENLTQIGGTLLFYRNGSLTSLSGLDNLSSIGNGLIIGIEYSETAKEKIEGSLALTSINALSGLASIGGELYICNTSLTSLTGLDSVSYIGSKIFIGFNEYLSDISGLARLNSISGLTIAYNKQLQACDVQSICNYLAGQNGTTEIRGNAPGCNSPSDVKSACQVGLENMASNHELTIYPNPSGSQFTFEFLLPQQSTVKMVVVNSLGQVVETLADGILTEGIHQIFWNAGNLPSGMYACCLQIGDRLVSGRILKM